MIIMVLKYDRFNGFFFFFLDIFMVDLNNYLSKSIKTSIFKDVDMKYQILVSCASSMATSTVVAMQVRELLEANGLDADVKQCSFSELDSKVKDSPPHLIIGTGPIKEYGSVPVIVGTSFLTGIGKEAVEAKILEILKSVQK